MPAIRISPEEVIERLKVEDVLLVDVRQDESYNGSASQITGSVRLDPNDDAAIQAFMAKLDKSQPVVTYCT